MRAGPNPNFFKKIQSVSSDLDSIAPERERKPQLLIDFKFLLQYPRFIKDYQEYLCDLSQENGLHILIEKTNGKLPCEITDVLTSIGNITVFFHEYECNDSGSLVPLSDIQITSKNLFVLSASNHVTNWAEQNKITCPTLCEDDFGKANKRDIKNVEEALSSLQTSTKKIILSLDLDDTTILFDRKNKTFSLNHAFLKILLQEVTSIKTSCLALKIECVVTTARKPPNNLSRYKHVLDGSNDNETTRGHVNFLLSELNRLGICNQKAIRVFHASCDGLSDGKRLCLSEEFPDSEGFFVIHFDDNPGILDDFTRSLSSGRLSMRAVEVINPYARYMSDLNDWISSFSADLEENAEPADPSVILTLN